MKTTKKTAKKAAKKAAAKKPSRIDLKAPVSLPDPDTVDVTPEEPRPLTEAFKGQTTGIRVGRNPNYVYGTLDGRTIPIFCGRKWASRLVGKPITYSTTEESGETRYIHTP